jgi:hypothetical protein
MLASLGSRRIMLSSGIITGTGSPLAASILITAVMAAIG